MAVTRIRIPDWAKEREADDQLDLSLAETDLPVRTVNCLEDEGILTIRQLLNCTPKRLLNITNFGEKTLEQVYEALEQVGFYRPTPQPAASGNLRVVPADEPALLGDRHARSWAEADLD
jgi:DNA-directed RNA polymerase subunit alpha